MTNRTLPSIKARRSDLSIDWDSPVVAKKAWAPVRAANDGDGRVLSIMEEIGDRWDGSGVTAKAVSKFLADAGDGDITVNINSPGGDFFDGVAIYNLLREHNGAVNVNVLGVAASAASIIAMASDNLRIAESGFLMIHNSWGVVIGNRHEMAGASELLAQFDSSMAEVYSKRSGMAKTDIVAFMDAETFFHGADAVEKGLADGLLKSDEIKPGKEAKSASALRRLDIQLAQSGLSRSERRALLADIHGDTPGAIPPTVTPGADEIKSLADHIRSVASSINA